MNQTTLSPEPGTSSATPTASDIKLDDGADTSSSKAGTRDKISAEAQKLKGKAGEKASEYAAVGKEKASDALDGLSRLLQDAAASVDQRLGENYGQYARKTADAISGAAASLREKDLNEVAESTREFVRKSPVIAVGAAAAVGFVLARLLGGSGGNDKD